MMLGTTSQSIFASNVMKHRYEQRYERRYEQRHKATLRSTLRAALWTTREASSRAPSWNDVMSNVMNGVMNNRTSSTNWLTTTTYRADISTYFQDTKHTRTDVRKVPSRHSHHPFQDIQAEALVQGAAKPEPLRWTTLWTTLGMSWTLWTLSQPFNYYEAALRHPFEIWSLLYKEGHVPPSQHSAIFTKATCRLLHVLPNYVRPGQKFFLNPVNSTTRRGISLPAPGYSSLGKNETENSSPVRSTQHPRMNYEIWPMNYELWNMTYELWYMNYEAWIRNSELWTMNYEQWTMNYEL